MLIDNRAHAAWLLPIARSHLERAGFDLSRPISEDDPRIVANPALRSFAVVAGLLPPRECGGYAGFLREAETDPLLRNIPSPEELAVCRRRARLATWIIMDIGETPAGEDAELLIRLKVADNRLILKSGRTFDIERI